MVYYLLFLFFDFTEPARKKDPRSTINWGLKRPKKKGKRETIQLKPHSHSRATSSNENPKPKGMEKGDFRCHCSAPTELHPLRMDSSFALDLAVPRHSGDYMDPALTES